MGFKDPALCRFFLIWRVIGAFLPIYRADRSISEDSWVRTVEWLQIIWSRVIFAIGSFSFESRIVPATRRLCMNLYELCKPRVRIAGTFLWSLWWRRLGNDKPSYECPTALRLPQWLFDYASLRLPQWLFDCWLWDLCSVNPLRLPVVVMSRCINTN